MLLLNQSLMPFCFVGGPKKFGLDSSHPSTTNILLISPSRIIGASGSPLTEFSEGISSQGPPTTPLTQRSESLSWSPPPDGFLKMNVDASWSSTSTTAGIGIVIRNSTGLILHASALKGSFFQKPLHAELEALRSGLSTACSLGISHLIIETDCASAAQALTSGTLFFNEIETWTADCRDFLRMNEAFSINLTHRLGNRMADALAKFSSPFSVIWDSNFPPWLLALNCNDHHALVASPI